VKTYGQAMCAVGRPAHNQGKSSVGRLPNRDRAPSVQNGWITE